MRCHSVHIALCLYEAGLLLLPNSFQSKLLTKDESDPIPLRRLNFATLIMMFTRKFEATDPQETLQYFYFLRDVKSRSEFYKFFLTFLSIIDLYFRDLFDFKIQSCFYEIIK